MMLLFRIILIPVVLLLALGGAYLLTSTDLPRPTITDTSPAPAEVAGAEDEESPPAATPEGKTGLVGRGNLVPQIVGPIMERIDEKLGSFGNASPIDGDGAWYESLFHPTDSGECEPDPENPQCNCEKRVVLLSPRLANSDAGLYEEATLANEGGFCRIGIRLAAAKRVLMAKAEWTKDKKIYGPYPRLPGEPEENAPDGLQDVKYLWAVGEPFEARVRLGK